MDVCGRAGGQIWLTLGGKEGKGCDENRLIKEQRCERSGINEAFAAGKLCGTVVVVRSAARSPICATLLIGCNTL